MLKNRFISQSTPESRRELQKLALGPTAKLGGLLRIASLVSHSQDKKKERSGREKGQGKSKGPGGRLNCGCFTSPTARSESPRQHGPRKRPQLRAAWALGTRMPGEEKASDILPPMQ